MTLDKSLEISVEKLMFRLADKLWSRQPRLCLSSSSIIFAGRYIETSVNVQG